MDKKLINYSQCWEDPQVLLEALSIQASDCVLSITSGGDNTLALLLAGPKKVDSVDLNPAQNYLLELKRCAAINLDYGEYLELMGVKDSRSREALFEKVQKHLPSDAKTWWLSHAGLINRGVINSGRFEKFTISFARYILPLAHSKKTILGLLDCRDLEEQREFYKRRWNSGRWRFFFGLASNRLMLRRFARQQGMFAYTEGETVADVYRKRLECHLTSIPIQGNYFLHYSLTGGYGSELPPYLEEHFYRQLQNLPESALSISTNNLLTHLRSLADNTYSKFNLSDIFEALSPTENDILWEEILRTAKKGARVAYWNNLVQRTYPHRLSAHFQTNEKSVNELQRKDMVFFYDSFHVHTILK